MDIDFSVELTRLRWHLAALRFELSMVRHAQALRKKYDPSQPRVPAGSRTGGQWTNGSNGVGVFVFQNPNAVPTLGLVLSDEMPDPLIEGAQYAQANITIDYSAALTGLSNVDSTTKELSRALAQTMATVDFIPEWTPQIYGTAVHVAFGTSVRFQGLPGIGFNDVEQSFLSGTEVDRYGQAGSIRTDVVLRNDSGDIIAIYDVKTGGARLTSARVRELRDKTGVGPNVPIVELHVVRGARLKGRVTPDALLRSVIARLWNALAPDK
jgi:dihydroxyacetone kinase DhaKLM complex PTS-EIIA-like component DhaM